MKKNDIFAALLVCAIITILAICMFSNTTAEAELSYAIVNDGGYVPVYKVQTPAMRIGNVVEVEWRGETYSAYLTPDSEIQTGELVVCTFVICEGEVELINIE